jgi:hypothetical protein
MTRVAGTAATAGSPETAIGLRRDRSIAVVLFVTLFAIYNANGREIGSYDSQPTKFAARELLLRGTLHLDEVVRQTPEYAQRWGFTLAADGHYRSVYSPVPAVIAAVLGWPLSAAGLVDMRAPLAPALLAKVAASLLVALSVIVSYFTARQWLGPLRATILAIGLGLGTGLWSTVSQTLWQTETAVLGLALAVNVLCRDRPTGAGTVLGAVGLALAGATRPQLAPIVAVLMAATWTRSSKRDAALATAIVLLSGLAMGALNMRWFGHPLGAQALLQDVNAALHATGQMFTVGIEGAVGLLVSPSRGMLVFSPIVLIAMVAIPRAFTAGWRSPLPWCALAFVAQYALYSSYSVWWGGHTYGPRYMLDLLPLAVPLAAVTMATASRPHPILAVCAAAALVWSLMVAATGAVCYPHERWNTEPSEIDLDHSRLWSLTDTQIERCWARGASPQNFRLIDRAAVRPSNP